MKKLLTSLLAIFALFTLAACGAQQTADTSAETGTVQLIVQAEKGQTDEKVDFTVGQTVLEILDANYDVTVDNGMVTAIDGLEQKPEENTYWMYKVNDEMASVGAGELKANDGDKIEFYQETFD
jgi:major membrane immunogen (membrane-anchored lipoprotein)